MTATPQTKVDYLALADRCEREAQEATTVRERAELLEKRAEYLRRRSKL